MNSSTKRTLILSVALLVALCVCLAALWQNARRESVVLSRQLAQQGTELAAAEAFLAETDAALSELQRQYYDLEQRLDTAGGAQAEADAVIAALEALCREHGIDYRAAEIAAAVAAYREYRQSAP